MIDALGGENPTEPVHGYKVGVVHYLGDGRVSLSGVGGPADGRAGDRLYEVDAVARCARGRTHVAPNEECTCGFWSVSERGDLSRVFASVERTWVDLEVESFGKVVVHEHGLRAERQRVLRVVIPPVCQMCGGQAVVVGAERASFDLTPRCTRHAPKRKNSISLSPVELAGRLGTEVCFGTRTWEPRTLGGPTAATARALMMICSALFVIVMLAGVLVAMSSRPTSSGLEAPATALVEDNGPVISMAARSVAGIDVSKESTVGDLHVASYPLSDGTKVRGAVSFTHDSATRGCAAVLDADVPAFVKALLSDSVVIDGWLVGWEHGVSASECLRWHDELEKVLARFSA